MYALGVKWIVKLLSRYLDFNMYFMDIHDIIIFVHVSKFTAKNAQQIQYLKHILQYICTRMLTSNNVT